MAIFFNALSAVSILLLLMGTGYFMGYKEWMKEREKAFVGKFILNFAVPATCITGLSENIHLSELKEYSALVLAGAVSVSGVMIFGIVLGYTLPMSRDRRGVYATMTGLSNTLFIGIPVVTQIFGGEAIPYLMMYFLSNTIWLQTVGMMLIRNSGTAEASDGGILNTLKDMVKKPPVIGIMVGFTMVGFDLTLPPFLWNYLKYIAGTVSPLALIYCGFILYEVGLSRLRPMPLHGLMLVLRLGAAPLITWFICAALGVTGLPQGVFTVTAGLPVVSQVPVFAGNFGADEEYAAVGASLSVLLCCVTIPLIMVVMNGGI